MEVLGVKKNLFSPADLVRLLDDPGLPPQPGADRAPERGRPGDGRDRQGGHRRAGASLQEDARTHQAVSRDRERELT